jgi:hypothetical protein
LINNATPLSEYKHQVKLRDGSEILIRSLCLADVDKYLSMFNCLSNETKFLRYHFVKLHMSAKEAEESCSLDFKDRFALAAERDGTGLEHIVGIGRMDRIGNTSSAEIAFLVDDQEQGKGICSQLLIDLVAMGKKIGITKCIGLLTNENVIMLNILRKFAPDAQVKVEGSDILATFNI